MAAAEPHLALLAATGCGVVVHAELTGSVHGDRSTPLSRRPVLDEADGARLGERLTDMARCVHDRHGLRLAYHHHLGTVIETEAEVDRLMRTTGPGVGLLLDTGHLYAAGSDPASVARRHAARVVHVHCKDVRPAVLAAARARDVSFLDAVLDGLFTVPGEGAVDYRAALAPVAAAGYRGWLVVEAEQDPARAHPLTYARLGHANLSALAAEIWRAGDGPAE